MNKPHKPISEAPTSGMVRPDRPRSFGRLASRMTAAEQAALDARLAAHSITLTPGASASLELAPLFAAPATGPLLVELGVGKGAQILARAKANPTHRFIACEVFRNGLRSLVGGIEKTGVTNLKIYPDDARNLLAALPTGSVDQLLVLYPDPWPKARHKKRRLVQAPLLDEAQRVLAPGGTLLLVTDVVDYALWMLHAVYDHGYFFPLAISPAEWAEAPAGWVSTGYERKALKEGRRPFYLQLRPKAELPQQAHNTGAATAAEGPAE